VIRKTFFIATLTCFWQTQKKKTSWKSFSVELKREKQDCLQFSIGYQIWWWLFKIKNFIWMIKITTKNFSFLITYRKLKAILFFSFKFDKIFNLFSSFEFVENFLMCIFLKCLFVFIFLVRKSIFEIWGYIFLLDISDRWIFSYTNISTYASCLGSLGLFSPFWPLKEYLILIHIKFQINRYITQQPYRFWTSNPVIGSESFFSPFSSLKACSFVIYIKFSIDGYITRP
jgi:hypothetical protein